MHASDDLLDFEVFEVESINAMREVYSAKRQAENQSKIRLARILLV
jgi:hypothetical protein